MTIFKVGLEMLIYIITSVVLLTVFGIAGILLKSSILIVLAGVLLLISLFLERCDKRLRELEFFLGQLTNAYMLGDIDDDAYEISRNKLINNLGRIEYFFYERGKR